MHTLDRKVDILMRLARTSAVLNSTLELQPLLAYLMDTAADITDCEAASVLLWDAQRRELYIAATTSSSDDLNLVGQSVPLEGSIAGSVMRSQQCLQVDNAHDDPRHYSKFDTAKGFDTRSILAVPLTAKDRTIGVLEVLNKRQLPWTEDNVTYLTILADQAAVAIRSAQLMVDLRRANEELSELDKLKNDFIAIASHELRTPLGVILGYASFLQDMSDGQVSDHATKVVNSALQLRGIIEDLTNLRFLKEGETTIKRGYVSLNSLVDDALGDVMSLGDARGHRLEIIHAPEDLLLFVDPIRVAMALTNVLNNAVRFTPDDGHIVVEATRHNSDEAWITVTDNGIGLNHSQLERIFDEFYQLEDHMTRKHGGLGIGLSIARALVDANGGRIWASSPGVGQGTTFALALPLAKDTKTR